MKTFSFLKSLQIFHVKVNVSILYVQFDFPADFKRTYEAHDCAVLISRLWEFVLGWSGIEKCYKKFRTRKMTNDVYDILLLL